MWADDKGYISYFYCCHSHQVKKTPKGWKQWGRKRGLYSWDVENALDRDLETKVAPIYDKLCKFSDITQHERLLWAQFILSQLVRTPTYIGYETKMREILNITDIPTHDRVGCLDCGDLNYVANRNWCYLLAHEDDFFVRSDNPVLLTGFIELPETCLYYPLTPKLCFVACSMNQKWNAFSDCPDETVGYRLEKGGAHLYNFYFSKTAGETLILSPKHDGIIPERINEDMLGKYPQPPFSLHFLTATEEAQSGYESIRKIMSITDGIEYPEWNVNEIQPFYQKIANSTNA